MFIRLSFNFFYLINGKKIYNVKVWNVGDKGTGLYVCIYVYVVCVCLHKEWDDYRMML